MPSPVPDRPGLLIRDPYQYSGATLIIPPVLVECLQFFDGEQTELDLRAALVRLTGELDVSELQRNIISTLSDAGFLENEVFEKMKTLSHQAFANADLRAPAHAGSAYPNQPDPLRATMLNYMDGDESQSAPPRRLIGIAAPHVSPEGGWRSYRVAYRALAPEDAERTFVVLGTSHYGESEHFGLTRKPFLTPFGPTTAALDLVNELQERGGQAALMEDYCHAVEHSIEFQVVFLQHLFGPHIRVLPILCGPFARSIYQGGKPEDSEGVRRFLGVLGELAAREGDRLLWVLGIDMAHMGRRYGDRFTARADAGDMIDVAASDRERIGRINSGDGDGFWQLVQENRDSLKWCGSAPLYTFLKAVPHARGELLRYEQWNIDEQSVVSFAGIAFAPER